MKLNKKEKKIVNKEPSNNYSYPSEVNRVDKWSRVNVFKNKKAYDRRKENKEASQW